jgi:hypothetical protein
VFPLEKMKELLSGEPIVSAAPPLPEVPSTKPEVSHWIRVSIGPDVELSFKPGTLSQENEEAIKILILSRIGVFGRINHCPECDSAVAALSQFLVSGFKFRVPFQPAATSSYSPAVRKLKFVELLWG